MLTQEQLKELLNYDQETGVFTWRTQLGNPRIGAVAGTMAGKGEHKTLRIGIGGKSYLAHRLAWLYMHGEWPQNDKISRAAYLGREILRTHKPGSKAHVLQEIARAARVVAIYCWEHHPAETESFVLSFIRAGKREIPGFKIVEVV